MNLFVHVLYHILLIGCSYFCQNFTIHSTVYICTWLIQCLLCFPQYQFMPLWQDTRSFRARHNMPEGAQSLRASVYISGKTQVPVLQLSTYSTNLPEF